MDDRDSAKCRKSKLRDTNDIFEFLMKKRQNSQQCCLLHLGAKKRPNVNQREMGDAVGEICDF